MTQCIGCGAILQSTDSQEAGYTPKIGSVYCQRCFRIMHYDDVTVNYQKKMDNTQILSSIQKMDALVVWVVDIFDFEANMIDELPQYLKGKDIVLCITKRDLLPDTTGNDKLAHFLLSRLEEKNVSVRQIVVTGDYGKDGAEEVCQAISDFAEGREVVIMGVANAGKSTILNALLGQNEPLTMSYHPGTTLGFTRLEWEGYTLYDSPGLHTMNSMIFLLDDKQLRRVIPKKQMKPKTFQCTSDQSFALGGLARIDIYSDLPYSVTAYISDQLPLHRGKTESADDLWKNHYGELLNPTVGKLSQMKQTKMKIFKEGTDVCIHGIGWLCIKGDVNSVKVSCNKDAKATCRKAMI